MTDSGPAPAQRSLTDSPWFWALLFSVAGMVAILIIQPKYEKRQGRLELQYQAHQEVERRRAAGEEPARPEGQEGIAAPPAPGELIIRLPPILIALVIVAVIAAIGLWRSVYTTSPLEAPEDAWPRERGQG